jgi:hypothetical protein
MKGKFQVILRIALQKAIGNKWGGSKRKMKMCLMAFDVKGKKMKIYGFSTCFVLYFFSVQNQYMN